ncbi:hypothetical protein PSYMP_17385 [Pseudomonas amygdali pv. morsprunorum str. M302280]|nr:hypothetical protein PSYMP_17385 [Pseudomonas amygdali pv. morsprunorum str. M302280]
MSSGLALGLALPLVASLRVKWVDDLAINGDEDVKFKHA